MASRPMSYVGWAITVRPGSTSWVHGMLSKPATAMSPWNGQARLPQGFGDAEEDQTAAGDDRLGERGTLQHGQGGLAGLIHHGPHAFRVDRQLVLGHGGPVSFQPLAPRGALGPVDEDDVPMTVGNEMVREPVGRIEIVQQDRIRLDAALVAVHKDDGKPVARGREVRQQLEGGRQDHPAHLLVLHQLKAGGLLARILVRIARGSRAIRRLNATSSTARLTSVKKGLRMSDTTSPMVSERRERNRRAARSGR